VGGEDGPALDAVDAAAGVGAAEALLVGLPVRRGGGEDEPLGGFGRLADGDETAIDGESPDGGQIAPGGMTAGGWQSYHQPPRDESQPGLVAPLGGAGAKEHVLWVQLCEVVQDQSMVSAPAGDLPAT